VVASPLVRGDLFSIALCSALALACNDPAGPVAGRKVEPRVAPPPIGRAQIAPPLIDRSDTSRVVLRDPTSLASTQVDLYRQADGVVDILWIVDTTGSMENQRRSLAGNFDRFIQTLVRLNTRFQIGVTTGDMSSTGERGALRGRVKIIDNDTPDPREVFRENTTFPGSRKRWLQALRAMERSLTDRSLADAPGKPNYGFLRPGAALAVIAVTDGDDESFGGTAWYARLLRGVKGKGYENLVSFSTIAGTLPEGCWPPGEESYFGSKAAPAVRLSDLARRTGGVVASICDETFEGSLVRIAEALSTLKRIFPLSLPPVADTLSVTVNGVPIREHPVQGWQYRPEVNSVTFPGDYVPPPGAELRLFYAIDSP